MRPSRFVLALALVLGAAGIGAPAFAGGPPHGQHTDRAGGGRPHPPPSGWRSAFPRRCGWGISWACRCSISTIARWALSPRWRAHPRAASCSWCRWAAGSAVADGPVPVPIETVAILGRQIALLDIPRDDLPKLASWTAGCRARTCRRTTSSASPSPGADWRRGNGRGHGRALCVFARRFAASMEGICRRFSARCRPKARARRSSRARRPMSEMVSNSAMWARPRMRRLISIPGEAERILPDRREVRRERRFRAGLVPLCLEQVGAAEDAGAFKFVQRRERFRLEGPPEDAGGGQQEFAIGRPPPARRRGGPPARRRPSRGWQGIYPHRSPWGP